MKESSWGYGLVSLGLVILAVLMLTQRISTSSEEDFYLGREVLASSMIDAVDYGTFRSTGELVMSKEKFVEIYLRRFAESVSTLKDYQIDFYDIREYPPKASVRIRTNSGVANVNSDSLDVKIDTLTSGVLETTLDRQYIIYAADGIYE
jgi:hypothetical protein